MRLDQVGGVLPRMCQGVVAGRGTESIDQLTISGEPHQCVRQGRRITVRDEESGVTIPDGIAKAR